MLREADEHKRRDGRRTALTILMLLVAGITLFQLGIDTNLIVFHLSYVVPPFAALIATFICAVINLLFHKFFEKHHLRILYATTSLPFFLFAAAILAHFFEKPIYAILASIVAATTLVWYILLLRVIAQTENVES